MGELGRQICTSKRARKTAGEVLPLSIQGELKAPLTVCKRKAIPVIFVDQTTGPDKMAVFNAWQAHFDM